MKLFSLVPAFFVLVSLCGSPVPPPPGTVSGTVFFDANRNGIQDSCDAGPPLGRYVILAGEGRILRQPAGRAEGFRFSDVPPGEYSLTLEAEPDAFWLLTTAPRGHVAQPVTIEPKAVSQQTLGIALPRPIAEGRQLIGLAYEDADGDRAISVDECGIQGSGAGIPEGTRNISQFPTDPAGSFHLVTDSSEFPPLTVTPGGLADSWWLQTAPTPAAGFCASEVAPQQRYAEGVYELNVGFRRARGESSIAGVLFLDGNGDGLREEAETAIEGAVSLAPECNGDYQPSVHSSFAAPNGFYFTDLPPGNYVLSYVYAAQASGAALQPVAREIAMNLADDQAAIVDFALRAVPSGTLIVHVYSDDNGNGEFDAELQEPLSPNHPVCYRDITNDDLRCAEPQQIIQGVPVPAGTYEVYIPYTDGINPSQSAEVREGEIVTLFIARRSA